MKFSRFLAYGAVAAGSLAATKFLQKRMEWEPTHNTVAICVDYDDIVDAALRAGISFQALLQMLTNNGASHVSLPERTLGRLLTNKALFPIVVEQSTDGASGIGALQGLQGDPALIADLAIELQARLPYTQAKADGSTLTFVGNLTTIADIGLGFDTQTAQIMQTVGLQIVPIVSAYDWPEAALIERSIAQAAEYSRLLGFAGTMVLGHEMYLNTTIEAMQTHNLAMVWFAESRHQRGDWFVAKKSLPNVVIAHQWSRETLLSFDYHSANHAWLNLVDERGVRLCYINFFRELHATAPLEGVDYVHHLKHVLEDAGYKVSAYLELRPPADAPVPSAEDLAAAGMAVGGLGAAALNNYFDLPESLAIPLALTGAATGAVLPQMENLIAERLKNTHHHHHDHDHDHHHGDDDDHHHHHHGHSHSHDHDDEEEGSYVPKLLSLVAAISAPLAAVPADSENPISLLDGIAYPTAAAIAMATATSGEAYQLRVEEHKGFNLDWALPLALSAFRMRNKGIRYAALASVGAAWVASSRHNTDPFVDFDLSPAEGHTHHASAATRLIGDTIIQLGPKPARKWAGLSLLGAAFGQQNIGGLLGTLGTIMGIVGFRRPERSLQMTATDAGKSLGLGVVGALLIVLMKPFWKRDSNENL